MRELFIIKADVIPHLTNIFTCYLYHGTDFRPDVPFPSLPNHFLGDVVGVPLHLMRTSSFLPAICKPGICLVINESVRKKLTSLPNIEFAQCVTSFVRVPFDPNTDYQPVFRRIPYSTLGQAFHSHFPADTAPPNSAYYELVTERHSRVSRKPKQQEFTARCSQTGDEFSVEIDPESTNKYPILFTSEGILIRRDVFDLIEDSLPHPYFSVFNLSLS